MSFFDMLGYLVMAPLLDYFGRVKTLTGAYSITGGSIIISSLITYFFPDVAFLGTVCRVLGNKLQRHTLQRHQWSEMMSKISIQFSSEKCSMLLHSVLSSTILLNCIQLTCEQPQLELVLLWPVLAESQRHKFFIFKL